MRPELQYLFLACERQSALPQNIGRSKDRTYMHLNRITCSAASGLAGGEDNVFWCRHFRTREGTVVRHRPSSDFITAANRLYSRNPEVFGGFAPQPIRDGSPFQP